MKDLWDLKDFPAARARTRTSPAARSRAPARARTWIFFRVGDLILVICLFLGLFIFIVGIVYFYLRGCLFSFLGLFMCLEFRV